MRKMLSIGFMAVLAACTASPQEQAAWQEARAANTVESYRAYIAAYPKGVYVSQAIDRLETVLTPAEIEELGLATSNARPPASSAY